MVKEDIQLVAMQVFALLRLDITALFRVVLLSVPHSSLGYVMELCVQRCSMRWSMVVERQIIQIQSHQKNIVREWEKETFLLADHVAKDHQAPTKYLCFLHEYL